MLVKRNESYNLRSGSLELETSGDLDVEVKVGDDLKIEGFTRINDFNWGSRNKIAGSIRKRE